MSVLGLDPSLTSTGYAYSADNQYIAGKIDGTKLFGPRRIQYIRQTIETIVEQLAPTLVAYEGYALGGRPNGKMWERAELGGVLKSMLYSRNIPLLLIPPKSLKLFAAGKGNAEKEDVAEAMAPIYGQRFRSFDEADAFALMRMGQAFQDRRLLPRDRRHYQHKALAGCEFVYGVRGST